jgi:hypothetical protein
MLVLEHLHGHVEEVVELSFYIVGGTIDALVHLRQDPLEFVFHGV